MRMWAKEFGFDGPKVGVDRFSSRTPLIVQGLLRVNEDVKCPQMAGGMASICWICEPTSAAKTDNQDQSEIRSMISGFVRVMMNL